MKAPTISVVLSSPIKRTYSYLLPKAVAVENARSLVGCRVVVPFGKKSVQGFVVDVETAPSHVADIKQIKSVLDPSPIVTEELIHLCKELADYYLVSLGEVISNAIPSFTAFKEKEVVTLTAFGEGTATIDPFETKIIDFLRGKKQVSTDYVVKATEVPKSILYSLAERGVLEIASTTRQDSSNDPKKMVAYKYIQGANLESTRLTEKMQSKLDNLIQLFSRADVITRSEILDYYPDYGYALNKAVELRILEKTFKVVEREGERLLRSLPSKNITLSEDQSEVLESLHRAFAANAFSEHLLHGVTGSGKTEVYLQLTEQALEQGRGVITVVPEISLTPQLLQRMVDRFGSTVSILHSALGSGSRMDQWRRLVRGDCKIAVGARSALFAPVQKLGLIILDEEHDASFKQDERFAYHGRDVARIRAKQQNALLLLGSATPDVETFYAAEEGCVELHSMPKRIAGMHQPKVELVDMKNQPKRFGQVPIMSQPLVDHMKVNLEKSEQTILFLNRRGYTASLLCVKCGEAPACENCSVNLTFHQNESLLVCHYCGYSRKRVDLCHSCRKGEVVDVGIGTQRIEEDIRTIFPEARVQRMDRDTTRGKSAHGDIIDSLATGDIDILIGTQMVTKGLDVANVTLVGVISADLGLNLPDFRAAERTFQLVTQVSGRVGRGKDPGTVYIQTYNPSHYAIRLASGEQYINFYREEIKHREEAKYPPFARIICFRFSSLEKKSLESVLGSQIPEELKAFINHVKGRLVGPFVAPIERLYRKYRWQALAFFSPELEPDRLLGTRTYLIELQARLRKESIDFKWDLDPTSFL